MNKHAIIVIILIFSAPPISWGQNDTVRGPTIYSWQVDSIGRSFREKVDTSYYKSHRFNPGLGHINLGQLGSAIQHNLFFERANTSFLFSKPYAEYLKTNDNTSYYRARKPYTFLKFITGGQQDTEARLWARHTQNINQRLNVGLDMNLIGSNKFYENERSLKGRFINIFSSYENSPYTLHGNININKVINREIGGIRNKKDFEDIVQRYIPGKLENAKTTLSNHSFNFIQKLSLLETDLSEMDILRRLDERETFNNIRSTAEEDTLGIDSLRLKNNKIGNDSLQSRQEKDTAKVVEDSTHFYITHRLSFQIGKKRYTDSEPLNPFYQDYPLYMDSSKTRDRARQRSFLNEFNMVYSNDFLTVDAGLNYNMLKYSYVFPYQITDTTKDYDRFLSRSYNNLSVEAGWDFYPDPLFRLWARGKYYLFGFNGGDFELEGGIQTEIAGNEFSVEGEYRYYEPSYFYQFYNSNYFRWNKYLSKTSKLKIGGKLHIPYLKTRISLTPSVIYNYTYLDTSSVPQQYHENLSLITGTLEKDFQFWKFHSSNRLVFQFTDRYDLLGIPRYYLHHRFDFRHKFHFNITGGNLYTQIGWDLFYYPSYYADAYMPALGLYHRQRNEKVGGKPLFNLHANFRVKRVNLFIKLYHLNSHIQDRDYYTAPLYPMSPMMVKFGVSWSFYD